MGIADDDHAVIDVERLPIPFERGGHGQRVGDGRADRPELLTPEEEQLVFLPVPTAGNIDRAANIVGPGAVAIARDGNAVEVIEKVISVEFLVPLVIRAEPVVSRVPDLVTMMTFAQAARPYSAW